MAEPGDRAKEIDGWQGACVAVGVFAGLLPLVRMLIGGGPGRPMKWLNGQLGDPPAAVVPICVVLVAVTLIAILERVKQRLCGAPLPGSEPSAASSPSRDRERDRG